MPVRPSAGVCEVVLFSAQHTGTLTDLAVDKMAQLVRVWRDRYEELAARPEIEYVFIFENKGEAIGVTIPLHMVRSTHSHSNHRACSESWTMKASISERPDVACTATSSKLNEKMAAELSPTLINS